MIPSKAYIFIGDTEIGQLGQLDVEHMKSNVTVFRWQGKEEEAKLKLVNSEKSEKSL